MRVRRMFITRVIVGLRSLALFIVLVKMLVIQNRPSYSLFLLLIRTRKIWYIW